MKRVKFFEGNERAFFIIGMLFGLGLAILSVTFIISYIR
jgi:hypothetical protein